MVERVERRSFTSAGQAILLAAGVGIIAGLISSLRVRYPFIAWPNELEGMRRLHAGIAFGVAVGLVLWVSAKPHPGKLLLAMTVTLIGWFAAAHVGLEVFKLAKEHDLPFPSDGIVTSRHIIPLLLSGVSAGAVGSGLTALGASIAAPALRRTENWIPIVAVGALFGCLVYPAAMLLYPNIRYAPINRAAIMLFLPWQAAVLGAIAYALTKAGDALPRRRSDALLTAAGLGIISGFVSILPTPFPFFSISASPPILLNEEHVPFHAGLAFGVAVAILLRLYGNPDPVKCVLAGTLALVAWIVAVNSVAYSNVLFGLLWFRDPGQAASSVVPIVVAIFIAGAVGAGLTALGASVAAPSLRRRRALLAITAVGALFALLFFLKSSIFLFVSWQAAVLIAVAYCLTMPKPTGARNEGETSGAVLAA